LGCLVIIAYRKWMEMADIIKHAVRNQAMDVRMPDQQVTKSLR